MIYFIKRGQPPFRSFDGVEPRTPAGTGDYVVFVDHNIKSVAKPFFFDQIVDAAIKGRCFRAAVVAAESAFLRAGDVEPCNALSVGTTFGCPKAALDQVQGFDESYATEKWRNLDLAVRLERCGYLFVTSRAAAVVQVIQDQPNNTDDERLFNQLLRDTARTTPLKHVATEPPTTAVASAPAPAPVDSPRNGVVRSPADDEPTARHDVPPGVSASAGPRVRTPTRPKMKK